MTYRIEQKKKKKKLKKKNIIFFFFSISIFPFEIILNKYYLIYEITNFGIALYPYAVWLFSGINSIGVLDE